MDSPVFDTIIAPATIAGTGAISLIRVSGPDALRVGTSLVRLRKGSLQDSPAGRVHFGVIYDGETVLDEVLCYGFRAPHSYTGEDSVEIGCHSSTYIVSRIIELAIGLGCRMAEPGEFTCRAYLNGKMDLTQAEAVADLISSNSQASHRVAISQLRGGFSNELRLLRSQLLEMTSLMELELDFSEEQVEFADRSKLFEILSLTLSKIDSLISSFRLGNAIKNGVPVAIVGASNSGKSTLLNSILGEQRAIVSDIAGTTRDTVEECFNSDGILFRFVDTAGIRSEVSDEVEKMGIDRSIASLNKAEIVLLVIDSIAGIQDELLAEIVGKIDFGQQDLILVFNKTDLAGNGVENVISKVISDVNKFVIDKNKIVIRTDNLPFMPICAKTGVGVGDLLRLLSENVKNRRKSLNDDAVLVTNMRHLKALESARTSLLEVSRALGGNVPTDLVAEDLRDAITTLGSITGEISSDEVLGEIFHRFCIGK